MKSVVEVAGANASRRQFLGGALALGAAGVLTACGVDSAGSGGISTGSKATSQIITAWPADITTMDPVLGASSQDWELAFNIYERLVSPKFVADGSGALAWDGLQLQPQLADFTLAGDTATFTIRSGAKFYPTGNPVTADDVIFTIQRLFDLGMMTSNISGIQKMEQVKKVDDRTIKINMLGFNGQPITADLFTIAIFREPEYGIVDSVEVKKHITSSDPTATNWLKSNPAGSGPYYLKSRTPGQSIELGAVPGYSPAPAYKQATIQISSGSVLSLVKGGSVNLAVYGLTQADVNSLSGDKSVNVIYAKAPEFTLLELGTNAGPFANQTVRQAVGYTLPYQQIISSIYDGHAVKMESYVTTDAAGYTPAWSKYTTNISKAKALMSQAGNPSVSVPLHFVNSDPTMQDIATLIKSSASQAGIEFILTPETPAAFQALITTRATKGQGSPDALLINWGSWIDDAALPVTYYSTKGGVNNYPEWSTPEIDEISISETFAAPGAARNAAFGKAQEFAADAAALFPITQANRLAVLGSGMTDVSFAPEMALRYWTIRPAS
jgi:peptide/nickel transport system substrate-binding protein